MMRATATWARAIATVFTVAMFYASVCTTACATGFCPDQAKQTASHDCEPSPSSHSQHSHHSNAPDQRDCSTHAHPSSLFVKSAAAALADPNLSERFTPAGLYASLPSLAAADPGIHDGTDLVPPLSRGIPVYQQISVLRI